MVKKEISSVQNWKETFWETALCSVNSSQRVTAFPSKSHSLILFLWNLQSDNWKPIEGYGEIEISSIKNWKEAFWETALCSVNSSHRVTAFPSRNLFANSLLVEFAKWYLEAHSGLWWKRKHPKIKTEKKLSGKLLCVLVIHRRELQLSLQKAIR